MYTLDFDVFSPTIRRWNVIAPTNETPISDSSMRKYDDILESDAVGHSVIKKIISHIKIQKINMKIQYPISSTVMNQLPQMTYILQRFFRIWLTKVMKRSK